MKETLILDEEIDAIVDWILVYEWEKHDFEGVVDAVVLAHQLLALDAHDFRVVCKLCDCEGELRSTNTRLLNIIVVEKSTKRNK